MTAYVANTNLTNTFDYWRNRTNELSYAMTNLVVTCESNTTVGNCQITGNFWANSIMIGNNTANTIIYAPTPAQKRSGDYFLNADGTWVLSPTQTSNGVIIGGGNTIIDTFPANTYNAVEYYIAVKDTATSRYQSTKIMLLHDDNKVVTTEYGTIFTASQFATFDVSLDAGNIKLILNTTAPSYEFKIARSAL